MDDCKKINQFIIKIKTLQKQTALSLLEKYGQKFQCFLEMVN